jgi:signal transduction histidine kinase
MRLRPFPYFAAETTALALFAAAGAVPWRAPLAYGVASLVLYLLYALLLHKLPRDNPVADRVRRVGASLLQLACMWAFPQLAFFFLNVLFVVFALSFLQPRLTWRELGLELAVLGGATCAMALVFGPALLPPLATLPQRFLTWGWYVVTLGRCAWLGLAARRLRDRIGAAHEEVQQLNAKLQQQVLDRTHELQETSDALAILNRQVRSFAESVAHDFRQPVVTIGGNASLLRHKLEEEPAASSHIAHLDRIAAAVRHMDLVCTGLSRLLQASRPELSVGPVDVSRLCESVGRELAQRMGPLRMEVQPGIAADADAELLRNAIEAVLEAAWTFRVPGDEAWLRVEAGREPGGELRLAFTDNGTARDAGPWLAVAETVARRHGGRLVPGTGAGGRVEFTLAPAAG